jgi:hypothetical protein
MDADLEANQQMIRVLSVDPLFYSGPHPISLSLNSHKIFLFKEFHA